MGERLVSALVEVGDQLFNVLKGCLVSGADIHILILRALNSFANEDRRSVPNTQCDFHTSFSSETHQSQRLLGSCQAPCHRSKRVSGSSFFRIAASPTDERLRSEMEIPKRPSATGNISHSDVSDPNAFSILLRSALIIN